MVKYLTLLFEVHQPFRLKEGLLNWRFEGLNSGLWGVVFDDVMNKEVLTKVSRRCYIPATKVLIDVAKELRGYFEVAVNFSVSGTLIEQLMTYSPEVLDAFVKLADVSKVEFLSEPYYHSLTSLYEDPTEFVEQVELHRKLVKEVFGYEVKSFVNTEMIYNNRIGALVDGMGFKAVITEGVERVLKGRNINHVYKPRQGGFKLLLRNYRLSDDVAFRFSDRSWDQHPLLADKYVDWLVRSPGDLIVLAMDYETFGEHHSVESGILEFLKHFFKYLAKAGVQPLTVSEAVELFNPIDVYDVPPEETVSWADVEKNLSAWVGDEFQITAFNLHKSLEKPVKEFKDLECLKVWRALSSSDHYYYISSKSGPSGEVHRYFMPYGSRSRAYTLLINSLTLLALRVSKLLKL